MDFGGVLHFFELHGVFSLLKKLRVARIRLVRMHYTMRVHHERRGASYWTMVSVDTLVTFSDGLSRRDPIRRLGSRTAAGEDSRRHGDLH